MPRILLLVATLAVLGAAQASEVFITKDSQGRPIYTDRPESLPAQKVNIATKRTEPAEVQRRYDEKMAGYADTEQAKSESTAKGNDSRQTKDATDADKTKRCVDARTHYTDVMSAQRLYEPGSTDADRRYLDSKEIDEARDHAKKVMDEFCSGQ